MEEFTPWLPRRYQYLLAFGFTIGEAAEDRMCKVSATSLLFYEAVVLLAGVVLPLIPDIGDNMDQAQWVSASHGLGLGVIVYGLLHYLCTRNAKLLIAGTVTAPLIASLSLVITVGGAVPVYLLSLPSPFVAMATRSSDGVKCGAAFIMVFILLLGVYKEVYPRDVFSREVLCEDGVYAATKWSDVVLLCFKAYCVVFGCFGAVCVACLYLGGKVVTSSQMLNEFIRGICEEGSCSDDDTEEQAEEEEVSRGVSLAVLSIVGVVVMLLCAGGVVTYAVHLTLDENREQSIDALSEYVYKDNVISTHTMQSYLSAAPMFEKRGQISALFATFEKRAIFIRREISHTNLYYQPSCQIDGGADMRGDPAWRTAFNASCVAEVSSGVMPSEALEVDNALRLADSSVLYAILKRRAKGHPGYAFAACEGNATVFVVSENVNMLDDTELSGSDVVVSVCEQMVGLVVFLQVRAVTTASLLELLPTRIEPAKKRALYRLGHSFFRLTKNVSSAVSPVDVVESLSGDDSDGAAVALTVESAGANDVTCLYLRSAATLENYSEKTAALAFVWIAFAAVMTAISVLLYVVLRPLSKMAEAMRKFSTGDIPLDEFDLPSYFAPELDSIKLSTSCLVQAVLGARQLVPPGAIDLLTGNHEEEFGEAWIDLPLNGESIRLPQGAHEQMSSCGESINLDGSPCTGSPWSGMEAASSVSATLQRGRDSNLTVSSAVSSPACSRQTSKLQQHPGRAVHLTSALSTPTTAPISPQLTLEAPKKARPQKPSPLVLSNQSSGGSNSAVLAESGGANSGNSNQRDIVQTPLSVGSNPERPEKQRKFQPPFLKTSSNVSQEKLGVPGDNPASPKTPKNVHRTPFHLLQTSRRASITSDSGGANTDRQTSSCSHNGSVPSTRLPPQRSQSFDLTPQGSAATLSVPGVPHITSTYQATEDTTGPLSPVALPMRKSNFKTEDRANNISSALARSEPPAEVKVQAGTASPDKEHSKTSKKAVRFEMGLSAHRLQTIDSAVMALNMVGFYALWRRGKDVMIKEFYDVFSAALTTVTQCKGVTISIAGDRMISMWKSDKIARACDAAALIQAAVNTDRRQNRQHRQMPSKVRIGISGGRVIWGNFSLCQESDSRPCSVMNVFGHPVNKAAALERYNKDLTTSTLVDAWVVDRVKSGSLELPLLFRPVSLIFYKKFSRRHPTAIYEIVSRDDPLESQGSGDCDGEGARLHAEAFTAVVEGEWELADELLNAPNIPVNVHVSRLMQLVKERGTFDEID